MSDHGLLDWYAARSNSMTLSGFNYSVTRMKREINDIPVVPIAYITYSSIYPTPNPVFLQQIEKSCEYGAPAEMVFTYEWTSKIVDGKTAYEGLHNLLPSPLCSQATLVSAPAFSPSGGTYTSSRTVSISTGTTGAIIRYTKDGTTPTETSSIY